MTEFAYRFDLVFLDEAILFLDTLQPKTRAKIIYNLWKARVLIDPILFKKVSAEVWEFRTDFANQCIRLLAFWDKRKSKLALVVITHGFIKKTAKLPMSELNKTIQMMSKYFNHENN
jgi:phage-related protein